ncbi:histone-lysine N-methyltransferase SETMAR [Plakobranchus ocellatus]|uniref:Histone-lysine N-methyltransferase SETMAR n=1 Tax=Plakobranchus ocellatus TaxID=259542 RepID=A0AAV3ZQI7_9GAST|nr:histone-lysine N-methyltransferase SETMAR [Plakobranchus ocellatus]
MAAPFPLSDRANDVRPGCKTQRIAPTLRQVADLMCARSKEREYFKTCIVGHVNCCLQCAPTLTQQWLQRYGWEILPHPAHSPDLAPSDFHLFGPLKRHLGGMAFETEDDLISELRNWFDNLDVDFFRVGINSLLSRWQKCIDLHGDYVEK